MKCFKKKKKKENKPPKPSQKKLRIKKIDIEERWNEVELSINKLIRDSL